MFLKESLVIGADYFICDISMKKEFQIPIQYTLTNVVYEFDTKTWNTELNYVKSYVFNNDLIIPTYLHDSPIAWEYNNDFLLFNTERALIKALIRFYELKSINNNDNLDLTEISNFLSSVYDTKPELIV